MLIRCDRVVKHASYSSPTDRSENHAHRNVLSPRRRFLSPRRCCGPSMKDSFCNEWPLSLTNDAGAASARARPSSTVID
ncbi:hypothetical protein EVAR_96526_1 [Eumeta japonica]|uniref:Uncharacterized protein n=1 Tax=Eumeta variegata TaxID=151549 RepID=A0A4C1WFP6_EUMVA|nr:hypothetical protein EVAR_96526_1 [Eumeta japonica]